MTRPRSLRAPSGWAGPAVALAALLMPLAAPAQEVGLEAAQRLRFPPLSFEPPRVEEHRVGSVTVLFLEDRTLPLVNLFARFEGGSSHFPRTYLAAATALPGMLRSGGTEALPPDSVDALMEHYALQTVFGGGGGGSYASLNTLREHLEPGLALWADMLRRPRFDSTRVEVWRGQELESVRRRKDDPGSLAVGTFNRVMFGDHPIGWTMDEGDLEPADVTRDRFAWVHARIFCPENLILGVTGDVGWGEIEPLLARMLGGWSRCAEPLTKPPVPVMREGPGVFVIPKKLPQSTVVMAQPGGVRQSTDPDFYASRIGDAILGASGFSSRIMTRLRTREGLAYSASSLWTAPAEREGLLGALTSTKTESTIAAARLILETMVEMTQAPPTDEEVETTVEELTNGFVFNFESPSQIVSRQMLYRAEGMPEDWLERYLAGVQAVDPGDVLRVFRRHLDTKRMLILIVGDPDGFDESAEVLGPVTVLGADGLPRPEP